LRLSKYCFWQSALDEMNRLIANISVYFIYRILQDN